MIVALVLGTLLSIGVLAYVLAPVVVGVKPGGVRRPAARAPTEGELAIAALREVEFDRATGKLSDADYAVLRERYASEALAVMRTAGTNVPIADDPAEAAVRAYRSAHATCGKCGIRPETDAIYCSNCGGYLPAKCASCNVAVTAAGVRYCLECGTRLAA
jgi:hypothetical protein